MTEPFSDGALTPAERRLLALLAVLRTEPVPSDPGFLSRLMWHVRWQRALRELLTALNAFGAAVTEGVTAMVTAGRRGGRGG